MIKFMGTEKELPHLHACPLTAWEGPGFGHGACSPFPSGVVSSRPLHLSESLPLCVCDSCSVTSCESAPLPALPRTRQHALLVSPCRPALHTACPRNQVPEPGWPSAPPESAQRGGTLGKGKPRRVWLPRTRVSAGGWQVARLRE